MNQNTTKTLKEFSLVASEIKFISAKKKRIRKKGKETTNKTKKNKKNKIFLCREKNLKTDAGTVPLQ